MEECYQTVKKWITQSTADSKAYQDAQKVVSDLIHENIDKGYLLFPSLLLLGYSDRSDAHFVFAVALKKLVSPETPRHKEFQTLLFFNVDGRDLLQRLIRLSSASTVLTNNTAHEASIALHYLSSSIPPKSLGLRSGRKSGAEGIAIHASEDLQCM